METAPPFAKKHHIEKAGAHHEIITEQAVKLVYDLTSGTPELINSLVFAALKEAVDAGSKIIDLDHINKGMNSRPLNWKSTITPSRHSKKCLNR